MSDHHIHHNNVDKLQEGSVPSENHVRQKKSSVFALIFTVIGIILMLVLIILASIFLRHSDELGGNNDTTPAPTFPMPTTAFEKTHSLPLSSYDERMTMAVYVTDTDNILQSVSLVMFHADTVGPKVSTIGLPSTTVIDNNDDTTLGDLFDRSVEDAQNGLNTYFSEADDKISVNYYIIFTYEQIKDLMTEMRNGGNSFFFELDQAISQEPNDGDQAIHLPAGKTSLHPHQVAYLFRYTAWPRGSQQRAEMHARVIAAFMNQYVTGATDVELMNLNGVLYGTSLICTFTAEEYKASYLPMFKDIAGYTETDMCDTLTTGGQFEEAATRFILSEETVNTIRSYLP